MSSGYRVSFIDSKNKKRADFNIPSLADIDYATTLNGNAKEFIDKLIAKGSIPEGINPDQFIISYRSIIAGCDVEVEPCYSDNESLKSIIPSVRKNDYGEEIVNPENLTFKSIVEEFLNYCILSRAFLDYARSFVRTEEKDMMAVVDGTISGTYSKIYFEHSMQQYEKIRRMAVIITKAYQNPEVAKSIYRGYNQKLQSMPKPYIAHTFSGLIEDALGSSKDEDFDKANEYIHRNRINNKEIDRMLKVISARNEFVSKCGDTLKGIDDFQM